MKNDLIEARLRRDTTLLAFLTEQKAQYADVEDDVAPLRTQLQQTLEQAQTFADEVLAADSDANTTHKRGSRSQLTALLKRLAVAVRAEATATNDTRLLALAGRPGQLAKLTETSFQEEARRLLSLAPERSAALSKRRFLPEHYQQAQKLLQEFRATTTEGRINDTAGAAGRSGLERLIKETSRLGARIAALLAVYQADEPEFWAAFQGAARVVRRGGQPGPDADDAPTGPAQ
ncbi:hypothetical protein KBK19_14965 [Microvirga sp. STR05]|uniref:Uncharacterized protein n=1 Tax=Hymenobacter duratus TaxID=2771356 RepID=A0ABR8JNI9_9BACT|nr:hypothetical protein [Hymenobacter duratus]MBD2716339.1 hypothetical protein [Hymenobacter duratus]MBR7951254.1 hypothetical protein [Microvirga sp. STR05]